MANVLLFLAVIGLGLMQFSDPLVRRHDKKNEHTD